MTATTTVETKQYGTLEVTAGNSLGNPRLLPVEGVTLSQWRADKSLTPPWLLSGVDLEPGEFAAAMDRLSK